MENRYITKPMVHHEDIHFPSLVSQAFANSYFLKKYSLLRNIVHKIVNDFAIKKCLSGINFAFRLPFTKDQFKQI